MSAEETCRVLEKAVQAACRGCQYHPDAPAPRLHTCHDIMAAVRALVLEAFDLGAVAAFPRPISEQRPHTEPDILIRIGKARAQLGALGEKGAEPSLKAAERRCCVRCSRAIGEEHAEGCWAGIVSHVATI